VTLGTIAYPFDRAITWLDRLLSCGIIAEPVFLQHGITNITAITAHPLLQAEPFVHSDRLTELVQTSRLVISHAGQGSTRQFILQGTRLILLPRLASYGEHVDDHQLYFARGVAHFGVPFCQNLASFEQAVLHPPPRIQMQLFSEPRLADHLLKAYPAPSEIPPVSKAVFEPWRTI
jgi:UDP-N-acetylglucosamine transferase subunit ALG13